MVETLGYTVVKKIDNVEIRQYPDALFAIVENNGDDSGFGVLFQYISGENTTRRRIAMTAPVVTSEKIAMTTPVVTRKDFMAFPIPSSYTQETVPTPTNSAIRIELQPCKWMAVLRFSGRTSEKSVQKYMQRLLTTLKTHGIQAKNEPVLMRYNSPFTPGFLRRNEVAVEISHENL